MDEEVLQQLLYSTDNNVISGAGGFKVEIGEDTSEEENTPLDTNQEE